MHQLTAPHRLGQRLVIVLALAFALVCAVVGPGIGAADPLDETIQTVTCTELLEAPELEEELSEVIDTSYCHSESDAVTCPPDATCTTTAEHSTDDGSIKASVTGDADPGGPMVLAVGSTDRARACDRRLYVGLTVRFESEGVSNLVATHRVAKAIDQQTSDNGVENLGVCYQSPKPFTDADGNSTFAGMLPLCDNNGGVAPCILHLKKNKADAIVDMKLPSGDPTWQMVEDTVDRLTG